MLSKEIVVEKFHHQVVPWVAPKYENRSTVTTQAALDLFIGQQVPEGEFVRYRSGIGDDIYGIQQMSVVLYIERDINKVKIGHNGWIESHLLLQCNPDSGHQWVRFADARDYIPVSQVTKDKWCNDKLQDYIAGIKATDKTYLEATIGTREPTV